MGICHDFAHPDLPSTNTDFSKGLVILSSGRPVMTMSTCTLASVIVPRTTQFCKARVRRSLRREACQYPHIGFCQFHPDGTKYRSQSDPILVQLRITRQNWYLASGRSGAYADYGICISMERTSPKALYSIESFDLNRENTTSSKALF